MGCSWQDTPITQVQPASSAASCAGSAAEHVLDALPVAAAAAASQISHIQAEDTDAAPALPPPGRHGPPEGMSPAPHTGACTNAPPTMVFGPTLRAKGNECEVTFCPVHFFGVFYHLRKVAFKEGRTKINENINA